MRWATEGLRPPIPNWVVTIQSLFIALSTDVATEDLADAANTVMNATNATPIISADDVAAVRRGFRMAFSRASVPATPRTRGSGQPTIRENRREIVGPSMATPTNTAKAPSPTALTLDPDRPCAIRTPPTTPVATPKTTRRFDWADVSRAVSRRASMGATLAARRAGSHAAATVTTMPVAMDTTTVRGSITDGPDGSSM